MAPEQARGAPSVDARSDLYSVGAVLYHMVTGKEPFPSEEDQAATLLRVVTQSPPRPREIDASIPEGLERIILHAMERDPKARPASAEELERLLAAFDDTLREEVRISARPVARVSAPAPARPETAAAAPERAAESPTQPTGGGRLSAMVWSIVFGICSGTAVFAASSAVPRAVVERLALSNMELAAVAAAVALSTSLGALRVLRRRWHNAAAIGRLSSGLRAAVLWNIASLGALALGFRAFGAPSPVLPPDLSFLVEIGPTAMPLLLSLGAYSVALWRAGRA
jgi:hypothetical protein